MQLLASLTYIERLLPIDKASGSMVRTSPTHTCLAVAWSLQNPFKDLNRRRSRVRDVICALELGSIRDSRIGDAESRGISGVDSFSVCTYILHVHVR